LNLPDTCFCLLRCSEESSDRTFSRPSCKTEGTFLGPRAGSTDLACSLPNLNPVGHLPVLLQLGPRVNELGPRAWGPPILDPSDHLIVRMHYQIPQKEICLYQIIQPSAEFLNLAGWRLDLWIWLRVASIKNKLFLKGLLMQPYGYLPYWSCLQASPSWTQELVGSFRVACCRHV
jgi:hypothetical protein